MASPLRELLAFFGISVDTGELEEADKKVDGFFGKLKEAGKLAVEAFGAHEVKEFFAQQIEGAAHLQDLAERLGITANEISSFGFAAKSAGLDVDSAAHALGTLQRTIGLATTGSAEQAKAFAQLHISLKDASGQVKPFNEVLGEAADAIQKLPDQNKRAAAAMTLFGRAGREMLPILAQGREKMEELFKESEELGSGLGNDFYKSSKEAREEFEHFGVAVQGLKDRALATVLPIIIRIGGFLKDVAKDVVEFTKQTTILKTGMLFLAGVAGIKLIGTLRQIAVVFGILKPTIGETLLALAKFALPIVAIGLLYLIFDDLFNLLNGGKSVIGDLLDRFFGVGTAAQFAKDLKEAFAATIDIAEQLGSVIEDVVVGALEQVFDALKGVGTALGDLASGHFKDALNDLEKSGNEMLADLQKRAASVAKAGGAIGDDVTLSAQGRANKRTREKIANATAKDYQPGGDLFAGPLPIARPTERAPIPGHAAASGASSVAAHVINQTNHNTVNVTGATDPEKTGKAAAGGIEAGQKRANLSALKGAQSP